MVRGIGVDIIEIDRIRQSIETSGDAFLNKIFTDDEIAYCTSKKDRFQHFAARFASKEAVSKALSTGWAGEFRWKDVEVKNNNNGKPTVLLHGELQRLLSGSSILLSISHSHNHVVAMALIEEA